MSAIFQRPYILRPRDGTASYQKITRGPKWIGRVAPHAEGGFLGIIGKTTVRAPTALEAFEEVSAKQMGYASAADLKARNSQVRAGNRVRKQRNRQLATRFMQGDFHEKMKVVDEIFGIKP